MRSPIAFGLEALGTEVDLSKPPLGNKSSGILDPSMREVFFPGATVFFVRIDFPFETGRHGCSPFAIVNRANARGAIVKPILNLHPFLQHFRDCDPSRG